MLLKDDYDDAGRTTELNSLFLLGLEFILSALRDNVGCHVLLASGMHSASMSRIISVGGKRNEELSGCQREGKGRSYDRSGARCRLCSICDCALFANVGRFWNGTCDVNLRIAKQHR